MKRLVYIVLGFLSMGLGILGIPLPVIPTVPFFLLSAFLFSKSSKRLHRWFTATPLYKRYLESYVNHRCLSRSVKIVTLSTITVSFAIGTFFSWHVTLCRFLLPFIWFLLCGYILFGVKTAPSHKACPAEKKNGNTYRHRPKERPHPNENIAKYRPMGGIFFFFYAVSTPISPKAPPHVDVGLGMTADFDRFFLFGSLQ